MHVSLRRANNALLGLIMVVNAYIIIAPFAPRLSFWWQMHHTAQRQQLTAKIHPSSLSPSGSYPVVAANTLTIPSMLLDTPILEGSVTDTYQTLDKGIWRWPRGSTPDKGGNTVLIGHRFTYTNPRGVLYFLNKVSVGDQIGLSWNGRKYIYKATTITEVPPSDTTVQAATADARLTIYTCTPLWNPKDRLVVVAELEKQAS